MLSGVGQGLGDHFAPRILQGFIQRYAAGWSIEELRAMAHQNADLATIEEANPQWVSSLRHMMGRFPSVRQIGLSKVLRWIKEVNPRLAEEMVDDPEVMHWLWEVWEQGKKDLLEEVLDKLT